jgi:hypothetical protein
MIKHRRVLAIAFGLAIGVPAYAGGAQGQAASSFMDGNKLLAYCRGNASDQALCIGYIEGVSDYRVLFREQSGSPPCPPSKVSAGQVRDVVLNWLIANPADRNIETALLAITAIDAAWHCHR